MIGTLISGRFRLDEKIGSGGMSTVYRAFDPTLERSVAIKLMHRDISSDPDQLERFRREARTVARLNHPHVVTVIDAGEDEGAPYIVFEYVEGETLKERIERMGRLPVSEAVAYAIEIGRALSSAHASRLVHRDVKPQNVLIDLDGRAKVTDFGIARSLETHGLTAPGRVLGTTDYVSPEQAMGHDVTEQSDIYSLGVCLYEMLTGEVPFRADTQVAVAMQHVKEPLPDVQRRRPEISAALAAVIEHATAKETRNRYATVDAMVHDLEEVLAIEAARTGETSGEATTVLRSLPGETADFAPGRLRRPRRALIASLLLVLLGIGAIAWAVTRTQQGPGQASAPTTPGLSAVKLGSNAAHDYDPEGDGEESPDQARNAIDGNRTTNWDTETYSGGFKGSAKRGVGLYVDTSKPVAARRLALVTATPGYTAQVYASNTVSDDITSKDWTAVSGQTKVMQDERIPLDTARRQFRYYLVWITALPSGNKADIRELALRK